MAGTVLPALFTSLEAFAVFFFTAAF